MWESGDETISNQYFLLAKIAASYSFIFLLLFLILGFIYDLGMGDLGKIVDAFIIPSTCIRERDIVIAPLVRVSVCLSVCVSPLNS